MHDTKDIILNRDGRPLLSVTLRAIHGDRIGLQITAVKSEQQVRDPRLPPTVERTQADSSMAQPEAKP
jgi:hypothetical protein